MRPKLLFLSQNIPYPPDTGAKLRTYNVLRQLAVAFDVTAICFHRVRGSARDDSVQRRLIGLSSFAEAQSVPLEHEASSMRRFWDHVRSVSTGRVYTYFVYESKTFQRILEQQLHKHRFSAVHVDSLDLSHYLSLLAGIPTVCTHHNVESLLLRRRGCTASKYAVKRYLGFQADLMEREEREWCPRVALNVTVSREDATVLHRIAPGSRIKVVPNGVDTAYFRPGSTGDGSLVFVGGTSWFPNRDALDYFAEEILPLLKTEVMAPPVYWVGDSTREERRRFSRDGLTLTGYVDDVRPYLQRASCVIVPLRVGGGTRLKILNAWAMGKAVVSTSAGCEGLAAEHNRNIMIADEPHAFASAIRTTLRDHSLRRTLEVAARETAETMYSWDVLGRDMRQLYGEVAGLHIPTSQD